jgi:hypothetical protein
LTIVLTVAAWPVAARAQDAPAKPPAPQASAQPSPSSPVSPDAGGAWLDATPITPWNQQGAAVPKPPTIDGEPIATGRCADQARPPEGPADKAVAMAGWTVVGPLQIFADTSVVLAASAADGMCRPLGYQAFVFVRGRLAGTLSPAPMNARTDGMLDTVQLFSRDRVMATFRRYGKDDPLCCPSRTTTVTYAVKRGTGGSTVVVESAVTAGKQGQ